MRILLVTATFPPSANGVAVSVNNLYKGLKKKGHDVVVLAPKNGNGYKDSDGIVRYPSINNPLVKDYPIPLLPLNRKTLKLINEGEFDVVHAHHPFYIAFFADIVSSLNSAPLVFTYHTRYDAYIKEALKIFPKGIRRKLSEYDYIKVCKKADLVIAPSHVLKKYIGERYPDSRVRVVPTGIPEFKIPKVSKEKLKKRYDLPGGKKILLSVSRLSKEKNVKLLLRTLKILPDNYHLLLVGTGPDEESLKELAGKLGVSGRVTFLGKINHDKVPEVYLSSDIFVFPSLIETQGLTLLEAAYFGMPIVAVDTDICREWIHQGGVVVKDEIMSFANGVKKLEKMDKGKIRAQAKKFANNFTNDAIVKEIISLYQEVIDNERKPSLKGKLKNKLETLDKYMKKAI